MIDKSYDDAMRLSKEIDEISKKAIDLARDYYVARKKYAEKNHLVNHMLAKRLTVEASKGNRNYGIDRLLLLILSEAIDNEDNDTLLTVHDRDLARAEYKSLEKAIEALDGRKSALQSILKGLRE